MKYLSLFSGIGGFELGIQQAYVALSSTQRQQQGRMAERVGSPNDEQESLATQPTCIGFSEIDKYATAIYQKHFPEHKPYGDITTLNTDTLPDFDLLVGGFPCQAFSIAGKRKGFDDTRGTLFFEIARILRAKQPRLFLLENVKGLLSHDNGRTFATIIATLDELGYDLQWQVLNSKNHGVPQNRERIFIVGHLRGTSRPQVFPFGANERKDTRSIGEAISNTLTSNYWKGNDRKSSSRTLVGDQTRIRRLTPTECERLQGFPDGWTEGVSDTQRYKCLGNAVTVNVIQAIMERLLAPNH